MKVLKTSQRMLTLLCICPWDESTSKLKRLTIIGFALTIFTLVIFGDSVSIVFFVRSMSVNMKECLYSVFQVAALTCAGYTFVSGFILKKQVNNIFIQLTAIHNISIRLYIY